MPRERIHHGKMWAQAPTENPGELGGYFEYTPFYAQQNPDAQIHHTDPSLDVNWNRDGGWVQVSVDIPREKWAEMAPEVMADPSLISRAIYTDVLDRRTINHLIRTLRRARDAAYGSDE